ncbi:MAG: hypothetical protein AAF438_10105 [Pseudomonadota bacterium]
MKQIWFCVVLIAMGSTTLWSGGWGPTYAIEIRGGKLDQPLVITDPSTIKALSFWVGPGTDFREFMGPVNNDASIVDWDRGEATERPQGLTNYEVRFLLEPRSDPPTFTVHYEPDSANNSGYIYYPRMLNSIVTHFVDGTWRYASTQWNEKIGSAIASATKQ